jgi:hypothetical protein
MNCLVIFERFQAEQSKSISTIEIVVAPVQTIIYDIYDINNMLNPEVERARKPQYEINPPLIINRWSSRSTTGENLNDSELMSLLETARWAPSSPPLLANRGDLFMRKEIQNIGTASLIC